MTLVPGSTDRCQLFYGSSGIDVDTVSARFWV
jgi:hypothetical protein